MAKDGGLLSPLPSVRPVALHAEFELGAGLHRSQPVVGTTYSPRRFDYHEGLKNLAARPGVKDGPSSEEATPLIQAHLCPYSRNPGHTPYRAKAAARPRSEESIRDRCESSTRIKSMANAASRWSTGMVPCSVPSVET